MENPIDPVVIEILRDIQKKNEYFYNCMKPYKIFKKYLM